MRNTNCAPALRLNPRSTTLRLLFCASLLLTLSAWGQTAYVTDGSGQDILAVSSTGTVSTVASLNKKLGVPVQVRVGGDNLLYIVTPTNILRMTQSGTSLQTVFTAGKNGASGFTGIRFDSSGNLYANTPTGVYVIPGVIRAVPATSFAVLSRLTTASCSPAGDLAFTAFGDLLIACNGTTGGMSGALFQCLASSLPGSCTLSAVANITGPVVGLAVDAIGNIITSSGSGVTVTGTSSSSSVSFDPDVPAYLEAVPFPAGGSPSCNTAFPSILVSTAIAGKNGKVWSLDTVNSQCMPVAPLVKPADPLAILNTNVPAVGLAAPATSHTLTKPVSATSATSDFHYGNASLELLPTSASISNCNLSMSKKQLSVSAIAARLAGLPVTPITFEGEQSWVTGFDGAYSSACGLDPASKTHIGISGFYGATNPHIVLIPDDPSLAVTVDELPFVYPIAPLQGTMGDLLIHNSTPPGVFTTTPTTIIAANVGFPNNAPTGGYLFCGFLSPFIDNPPPQPGAKKQNIVNSGQSATFKFQLGTNSCNNLVPDSVSQGIHTGFSIAQYADAGGNVVVNGVPVFAPENGDGKGNSVSPPTFRYDASGHQFIYTLDTTGYCSGLYEATANGDIFQPHTLSLMVVGGPAIGPNGFPCPQ